MRAMRWSPLLLVAAFGTSACFGRGSGIFAAIAATAIVTAVVVSAHEPPPPRVVFVPEPRAGYAWQPGYWTLQDQQWVWVEGQWLAIQPGYAWQPAHWQHEPDGNWRLYPGQWVPEQPQ
jgi:hypothetical protein